MGKRKGRRPRRLFPAKFASQFVAVPRIDHNKAAAYNQQRSKATIGSRSDTLPNPYNNFMHEVPRTRSLTTWDFDLKKRVPSERKLVVDKKHELLVIEGMDLFGIYKVWQSKYRNQGVSEYYRMYLKGDSKSDFRLMLFFSGTEYLYVQEAGDKRWISKTYARAHDMREEATQRFLANEILWRVQENR